MARADKQTITKDPVFALIEAHRSAIAAEDALNLEWHAVTSTLTWSGGNGQPIQARGSIPDGLEDRTDASIDTERRARSDLIEAKPTTRAGKKARDEASQGQHQGNQG